MNHGFGVILYLLNVHSCFFSGHDFGRAPVKNLSIRFFRKLEDRIPASSLDVFALSLPPRLAGMPAERTYNREEPWFATVTSTV